MSQRQTFVEQASQEGSTMSALCRTYGISRQTGYKWLRRYQQAGLTGLADHSRRPRHSPTQTAVDVEALVVAARQRHPAWGARKLKRWLEDQGHGGLPAVSTLQAILQRHGLVAPSRGQRPYQRFERALPNELWQMDFKGPVRLSNQQVCHPLTVLDDHSRFLLGLKACANQQTATVQRHLESLFQVYGLPEQMLMDHGSPWGDDRHNPYTVLTAWLLRLGIAVSHGRPRHPQTQGKDERLHRTLAEEVLHRTGFSDLEDCQAGFDAWREVYNQQRPHQALDLAVPASRYHPSPRPFPVRLPALVYPSAMAVRKVDKAGKISYRNQPLRAGLAFAGQVVGVSPDPLCPARIQLFYAQTCIRTFELEPSIS